MIFKLMDNKWTIASAVVAAWLLNGLIVPAGIHWYNAAMPVVAMHGEVVSKTSNSVVIHIVGEKIRACRFLSMAGYVQNKDHLLSDTFLERVDGIPDKGDSKPPGGFDLGTWRIWPTEGAIKALVFVQHECHGQLTISKIAEVPL